MLDSQSRHPRSLASGQIELPCSFGRVFREGVPVDKPRKPFHSVESLKRPSFRLDSLLFLGNLLLVSTVHSPLSRK